MSDECGIDPALERGLQLLSSIPIHARRSFAAKQLSSVAPALVRLFSDIAKPKQHDSVLFLSIRPHSREARLALAAREGGWTPYLVSLETPRTGALSAFANIVVVRELLHLVYACWLFPGRLVHAFGLKGDALYLVARLKPEKLVVDFYDTCAGTVADNAAQKAREAFVLERADGATHRDTRLSCLRRLGKLGLPSRNLFLHEPITQRPPPNPSSKTGLKVISTGWLGEGDNSVLRVVEALLDAGIQVCLVLNPTQRMSFPMIQPYLALAARKRGLAVRESVFGDAYWRLLQEHDFGLAISEPGIFSEQLMDFTQDAMENCGSSRLADYISAGLGVITSPNLRFQNFISRHFAAAHVVADRTFLSDPVSFLRKALALKKPRDLLSLSSSSAGPRLIRFYHSILNDRCSTSPRQHRAGRPSEVSVK